MNPIIEICMWEKFLAEEKIDEQDVAANSKVWKFVQKNWDKYYIPTKVLKMYDMDCDG